jgi:hypothetical protein
VSSSGDAVEDTTDATLAWTPLGWEKFHPLWWKIKIGKKQLKQDGLQLGSHLMQKQREACQDLSKLLLLMRNLLWNN